MDVSQAAEIQPAPDAASGGVAVTPAANRRRSFRVSAPQLSMRAWRMDAYERLIDRPLPSRRMVMSTVDLGRNGAGVLLPTLPCDAAGTPTIAIGDRWRLEVPLDGGTESLLIEGRIASLRPLKAGEVRIGLVFRDQLTTALVRRAESAINKLMARLEREAIRKAHSLPGAA
jgi:hypothetical protein